LNVVADMYRLLDSSAVTQLHDKAISLAKAKYEALAMAPHPAMLHVIDKSTAYPEVPSWAVSGKQNWNVHFTVRRREARDLFIDLVERIRKAGPALEVRVNKYHISLYSGPTMAAVIYPRRDNLMFLMKNVEDQYDGTTLQKSKKPAGEPCIESASQFLIVYSRDEFDEAIRLLRLAAA